MRHFSAPAAALRHLSCELLVSDPEPAAFLLGVFLLLLLLLLLVLSLLLPFEPGPAPLLVFRETKGGRGGLVGPHRGRDPYHAAQ